MLQVFGGLTHTCSHPPTSPMATKASILVLVMINGGIRGSALISPSLVLSPSIHHAQIHKYKVLKRPYMCYIFEKHGIQGYQI